MQLSALISLLPDKKSLLVYPHDTTERTTGIVHFILLFEWSEQHPVWLRVKNATSTTTKNAIDAGTVRYYPNTARIAEV